MSQQQPPIPPSVLQQPRPGQPLPTIPGYPPPQSFAQWQWQRQQYLIQHHQQQHPTTGAWKQTAMGMGMGFGMGMFVGGSVGLLHTLVTRQPLDRMALKRAGAGGMAFGVIFSVGSLVRPH